MDQNSIDQLLKKFPKSHRVFRLKGMFHEAKGKWDKAEEVYQQLIEHDPSDTVRLFALLADLPVRLTENVHSSQRRGGFAS